MGRGHSFFDQQFRSGEYHPGDPGSFDVGLVAVAMPFQGAHWDDVYREIRASVGALGLRPVRVDEYVSSGIVLRDIAELIEHAEFLIFDLSEERPNVYYELGYAHGVGNEAADILLVAARGTPLHYDIAGLRVEYYDDIKDLGSVVKRSLAHMIRATRGS